MLGITKSFVVTPFVSPAALTRMQDKTRLGEVDNVLLEWWLAIILHSIDEDHPVVKILPVFSGKVQLFMWMMITCLS